MFYVWIDGHDMSIIEADGTDTEAYPVDHVSLSVAQRYSVLVTARNDTNSNFLFHANFDSSMFDTVPDDLQLSMPSFSAWSISADRSVHSFKTSRRLYPTARPRRLWKRLARCST